MTLTVLDRAALTIIAAHGGEAAPYDKINPNTAARLRKMGYVETRPFDGKRGAIYHFLTATGKHAAQNA